MGKPHNDINGDAVVKIPRNYMSGILWIIKHVKDEFGNPKFRSRRDVTKAAIGEYLLAHGWPRKATVTLPPVEVSAR